jgi:non-specific serine/threonine protein kinase
MPGQKISHYEILEKLGEGGAGEVYKARDTKLGRIVALKFLSRRATASKAQKDRFIREARAAAVLDHPNICTVYDIDEADDQLFISMAYIDGRTVKDKVRAAPMTTTEAVAIGVQVAEGLEAAHKRSIVHRDIKSANILMTEDGYAKITDFGLAKVVRSADITTTNLVMGTPAYMSPEQARGDTIDPRTDIWSWGVMFYEMLVGDLPFKGDHPTALVQSILHEAPLPLALLNPDVPHSLQKITDRALTKRPADRYQSVAELLYDLRSYQQGMSIDTPSGPFRSARSLPSIAVMAFTDMSPQKDQEYFCDGIADEIINDLTHVDGLRVASRTSAFAFKDQAQDIRGIGSKLGVDAVLEGSVRKAGDRVRITARLVEVADGYQLWSEQYDRELQDVFAIQEEIAHRIVEALRIELSEQEKQVLGRTATTDVEAYEFYLRGRQFFYRSKRKGIEFALEMFGRATEKDSDFALAYAGMADCYSFLHMYFDSREENLRRADEASARALELGADLAESHAARGLAVSLSKRYEEAEREFEEAVRLNPHLFEAYYFYARTCFTQGKREKATRLYEKACKVSPDDYQAPSLAAFTYKGMGLIDKSKEAYGRSLVNAEKKIALNPDDSRAYYLGSHALLELDRRDEAMSWAERAYALDPDDPYLIYGIACFYAQLGDPDRALEHFENALKAGFAHKEWLENDTDLDPIRGTDRFRALVRSLG